jgi:hypothetical protein
LSFDKLAPTRRRRIESVVTPQELQNVVCYGIDIGGLRDPVWHRSAN